MAQLMTPDWIAKQLRIAKVEPWLWEWLEDDNLIYRAEVGGEEERQELVDLARSYRKRGRRIQQAGLSTAGVQGSQGARVLTTEPSLVDAERERARVMSEYVAAHAAMDPEVVQFRSEVLAQDRLTEDEAAGFLASPATRHFDLPWFREHGISPVAHHATMFINGNEEPGMFVHPQAVVRIDPPGLDYPVPRERYPRRGQIPDSLTVPGEDSIVPIEVLPGSILDELRELSIALALRYYWRPADAAWFLLTGSVPWVAPMRRSVTMAYNTYPEHCFVTLIVEPWVSYKTVVRAYRESQRQLLRGENRPLSRRNLAVFHFVTAEGGDHAGIPLNQLVDAYNASQPNPALRYEDPERRYFSRDYHRAAQALLHPPYLASATSGKHQDDMDEEL